MDAQTKELEKHKAKLTDLMALLTKQASERDELKQKLSELEKQHCAVWIKRFGGPSK
jgi:hypothetical protein